MNKGHYGIKPGTDPLPRFDNSQLLEAIDETMVDIMTGHDAAGNEINPIAASKHMLETQMASLCMRVDKLLK